MNKTYLRKTTCMIFMGVAITFNLLSVILSIIFIIRNDKAMAILSVIMMSIFSLIFWFVYYIEKRSKLVLTNDSITFYYPIESSKVSILRYDFARGYEVEFDDVKTFRMEFHPGDGIFTANTTWYYFELNDGANVKFALFHFGKKQEMNIKYELKTILGDKCNKIY